MSKNPGQRVHLTSPITSPITSAAPNGAKEDPIKALFDLGVAILTKAGKKESQARAIVGQLRKACGDGGALDVLIAAKPTTDPATYVQAAILRGNWQEWAKTNCPAKPGESYGEWKLRAQGEMKHAQ